MATFTTNYNLRKPATTDLVDVLADIGANMDTIDTQLKTNADNNHVPQVKIKTADTQITSSTTLVDDPHLNGFNLTAGKKYELDAVLFISTDALADFKFHMDWTGVATSNALVQLLADGAGQNVLASDGTFMTGTFTLDYTTGTPTLRIIAMIFCTTTGVLDFQWAQGTSKPTPTIVKKHSYIKVTEVVAT